MDGQGARNVHHVTGPGNSPVPTSGNPVVEKTGQVSPSRDAVLAKVEMEKTLALVKAWEENEKAKLDNKAQKKFSAVGSWETTKKASIEAQLKKLEEKIERKKAHKAEKINNKLAAIRKAAEEKRVMIEAKRGEEIVKVEETAALYQATGYKPKKQFSCFSGF